MLLRAGGSFGEREGGELELPPPQAVKHVDATSTRTSPMCLGNDREVDIGVTPLLHRAMGVQASDRPLTNRLQIGAGHRRGAKL